MGGVWPGLARCSSEAATKPDAPTALEVEVAEELEAAVHGVDLDQALEVGIAAPPVARFVGVRDDQHVGGSVGGGQAAIEIGQERRFLHRHSLAIGGAEEDVVMAAVLGRGRPFVAEEARSGRRSRCGGAPGPGASSTRRRRARRRAPSSRRSRAASPRPRSGRGLRAYPAPPTSRRARGSRPREFGVAAPLRPRSGSSGSRARRRRRRPRAGRCRVARDADPRRASPPVRRPRRAPACDRPSGSPTPAPAPTSGSKKRSSARTSRSKGSPTATTAGANATTLAVFASPTTCNDGHRGLDRSPLPSRSR